MKCANIAIIEGDASVRKSAESLLRATGYVTAGFASVEAFLKFDQRIHMDCVILDIFLPGMCGMEAIPIFKRDLPNAKIIAISGSGRPRDNTVLKAARRLGADAAFTKHFDETQLLTAVRGLLPNGVGTVNTRFEAEA